MPDSGYHPAKLACRPDGAWFFRPAGDPEWYHIYDTRDYRIFVGRDGLWHPLRCHRPEDRALSVDACKVQFRGTRPTKPAVLRAEIARQKAYRAQPPEPLPAGPHTPCYFTDPLGARWRIYDGANRRIPGDNERMWKTIVANPPVPWATIRIFVGEYSDNFIVSFERRPLGESRMPTPELLLAQWRDKVRWKATGRHRPHNWSNELTRIRQGSRLRDAAMAR